MTCLAPMTTPFWPAASSWHFLVCCCSLCPWENASCHYLLERRWSAIGLQKSERSWWRIQNVGKIWLKRRCELVTMSGSLTTHTCEEISFLNFLTLLLNCKCCVLIFIFGDCLSVYMCIIWRIFMLALLILFNIDFFFFFYIYGLS